jgi:hypothetical protein
VPLVLPAPLFLRLFKKKRIVVSISQPTAGTSLRCLEQRLKIALTDEQLEDISLQQAQELQVKHTKTIARIVAILILGGKKRSWLFARLLAGWLTEALPFSKLLDIVVLATLGAGTDDFLDTIRLTRLLRLTAPNNQSPKEQRS